MNALILNDIWDGVCDGDIAPTKPTNGKGLAIWNVKNKKAYALISSSAREEINHHIKSVAGDAWIVLKKLKGIVLKKLKGMYDSHLELEFIQLQLKLFSLKLKDSDPMAFASKIKTIMQDIDATSVKSWYCSHVVYQNPLPYFLQLSWITSGKV